MIQLQYAALKLCRKPVVTASIDSVDFIQPIREGDAVTSRSNGNMDRTHIDGSTCKNYN